MLPCSSSKAARLSGVASRTASRTSEERASPSMRAVWVRNISCQASIWSNTRRPPSLSLRMTPSLRASRSTRLSRPLSPIAALPLPLLHEGLQLIEPRGYLFLLASFQRGANGPDIGIDGLDGNGRDIRRKLTLEQPAADIRV